MNKRRFKNRCFLDVQKSLPILLLVLVTLCGSFSSMPSLLLSIPPAYAAGDDLTQSHFHWRDDDGSETAASSLTSGGEDVAITNVAQDAPVRLRIAVSNEGTVTSSSTALTLEYGTKVTTCENIPTWLEVGQTNAAFVMHDSSFITDGANTTNIAEANGGVTDENTTFLASNAALKDTSASIASTVITPSEFIEAEFSLVQSQYAGYGTNYCFRLTKSGVPLDTYTVYPELTTAVERDFTVQRGTVTISGTQTTITAGVDYTAPSTLSSAFIRITNSHHTGAGDSDGGTQPADDVTVVIANPENLLSSVTFERPSTAISNTHVSWEIVEFIGVAGSDNEFVVKAQDALTYDASLVTATGTAVTGIVDDTDVAVFITGQQNPDTGVFDYNTGQSISSWGASTDQPIFERGEAGTDATKVSYAVVEFTGANWKVQRSEHTYTQAGVTETEVIEPVNSLTHTFIHTQKLVGTGLQGTDEFGHAVWLSSIGAVSFSILAGANDPSSQTSVAWVIENMQTTSGAMEVTRSNGSSNGGTEPLALSVEIGTTLDDITNASIFSNTTGDGTGISYPRPIAGFTLSSTTHYQLWRSDTGTQINYRTEVVEWPTAKLSLLQNDYRLYVDNDALDPTDPWPSGATDLGENTVLTESDQPLKDQERIRIRMSLTAQSATFPQYTKSFKLQFADRVTSCSAIAEAQWTDVGAIGSGAIWRGYDALSVSDGTVLSSEPPVAGDLNLSTSDTAGTFEEENMSTANIYAVAMDDDVEYDWVVEQNGATSATVYCFRMVEQNGLPLGGYEDYPQISTASFMPRSQNWRWYADAENETPTSALAAENTAPSGIDGQDAFKLRVTIKEISDMAKDNTRFKLQYSQFADFSQAFDVVSTTTCSGSSAWCYYDGGGDDNQVITTKLLSDADSCSSGIGEGCGTHNEGSHMHAGFRHENTAATEYEFTIIAHAPAPNTVYYFRLYDVDTDEAVPVNTGETNPSLTVAGTSLFFTISGLAPGTTTEGVVLDATSTATSVAFGSVPFETDYESGHRLMIQTNATEGYQVLMVTDQQLINGQGSQIQPVDGTNNAPSGWEQGCSANVQSCFGYHTGDDLLQNGSARFGAEDTFAAFSTTPQEVMYSSIPADESHDIVYRLKVGQEQPSGIYQTNVTYIAVPVF